MKKLRIIFCTLCFAIIFMISAPAFCAFANESVADILAEETGTESLKGYIPEETADTLEDLGAEAGNPLSVLSITEEGVFGVILDAFSESLTTPAGVLISLFILITVCSVYETSLVTFYAGNRIYTYFCAAVICCILVVPLSKTIYRTGEVIELVGYFVNAFVPVYCSALIMCGKTATATAYSTGTLLASEVVTTVSYKVISPACGMVLALNVAGGVSDSQEGVVRFSESISKSVKWLLGIVMTIFSTVMTFRTMAGAASDSFLSKTGRYIISTSIPVVGGSVSEAYSAVRSSASLIGTGVGMYGIIAVCVIMLPVFAELLLYRAAMSISSLVADIFGLVHISRLLRSVGETVSVLSSVMVCVFLSFVVSLAAVYMAGGVGR